MSEYQLAAFGVNAGQGHYDEEAFYGLVLVHTLLFNRISRHLDQYDLTPAKMNVLMVIKHQGGAEGLSQREIGGRLMVTASNMTRLLDKLERDGLIERASRNGDRRVKVIRISAKGSELLDRVWPEYRREMQQATAVLNKEDQRTAAELMARWLKGLQG